MIEKILKQAQFIKSNIEFGFEKEFVLQATSKENNVLYNLNIAPEFIRYLSTQTSEFKCVEEYSYCLIEIVSDPYSTEFVFDGLNTINEYQFFLEEQLHILTSKYFPHLKDRYWLTLSDQGASSSNLYLNQDLEIISNQKDPLQLVLPEYGDFVKAHILAQIDLGLGSESMIDIYNHVNSFHLTFHPTLPLKNESIYFSALDAINALIREYEIFDMGNRTIYRQENQLTLQQNLRDIFFKSFLPLSMGGEDIDFSKVLPRFNKLQHFNSFTDRLMKRYSLNDIDEAYRRWSSFDMRPRLINKKLPGIEVRRFGSSFSKSKEIQRFIETIIDFDQKSFQI